MNKEDKVIEPKLRFPEFKGKDFWKTEPLGKLAKPLTGKVGEKKVTLMSITSGVGLVSQLEKFGREIAGSSQKNYIHIKNGDFAYNKSSTKLFPEGEVALLEKQDEGAVPNSIFTCFRFGSKVVPQFAKHPFSSNIHGNWLRKFIAVGARANGALQVNNKDLFATPFPYPSPAEQQKIADCLLSLDELIQAETERLEALQAHKKGLMQQLFPAEGETVPKLRFPEFQDSGEWVEKKLGDIAEFINGKAYKIEELLTSGKYRVLRVGNFFTNNQWYYSDMELEEDKYCNNGDLLYAWSASFGPRIWKAEKVIYHYHIWKVLEKSKIDKQFLFVLLDFETENIKAAQARGLGMQHLTKSGIESWESTIPQTKEEQQKIASCLSVADELIAAQMKTIEQLQHHKKGLLQQLFPQLD